jgi:Fibronectin type III domain
VQARPTTSAGGGSSNSPNSLQFTWQPPARANGGPILEYRVAVVLDLSYSPDRKSFAEKSLRISNTTTSATVIGRIGIYID